MPSTRQRKSRSRGYRTRTGCVTCKNRRVKCDETQPFCIRCLESGRPCAGYEAPQPIQRGSRSLTQSLQRSPSSLSPGGSGHAGSRHYEYFVLNTLPQLVGNFESDFWSRLILQLRIREPAVEHAIIALGAAHERRDLCVLNDKQHEASARRVALSHYNKAILALNGEMTDKGSNAIEIALVCCILFICLETLQRNVEAAIKHFCNGVDVFCLWKQGDPRTRRAHSYFQHSDADGLEDDLMQLFTSLDTQATGFLDDQPPIFAERRSRFEERLSVRPEENFAGVVAARRQLYRIFGRVAAFLNLNHPHKHKSIDTFPPGLQTEHTALVSSMQTFEGALGALDAQAALQGSERQRRGLGLVRIQSQALKVLIGHGFNGQPTEYYNQTFMDILDLAQDFAPGNVALEATTQTQYQSPYAQSAQASTSGLLQSGASPVAFSLDADLIPTLYLTAMTAASPGIRDHAIDLMRRLNLQEGLWSSSQAAEIAHKALEADSMRCIDIRSNLGIPKKSRALGVIDHLRDNFEDDAWVSASA